MEITTKDGTRLFLEKKGSGSDVFIFIHGGGGDGSHVAPQFEYFSQYGTAINVDLRGFGKSARLGKNENIEQYAKDIVEICQQLNISNAIIIGHSMGGMVAVELAAKYSSLIKSIILISSGVIFPKQSVDDENSFLNKIKSPEYKTGIIEVVDSICLPTDKHTAHIRKTFLDSSQQKWINHFEDMLAWDLNAQDLVKKCNLPVLYISDDAGIFSDLTVFAQLCPSLKVGKVVGSGHFPTLEVPEQVNPMIKKFLEVYVN